MGFVCFVEECLMSSDSFLFLNNFQIPMQHQCEFTGSGFTRGKMNVPATVIVHSMDEHGGTGSISGFFFKIFLLFLIYKYINI